MNTRIARTLATAGLAAVGMMATTATAGAQDNGDNPFEAAIAAYVAADPKLDPERARYAAAGSDARRKLYDAVARDAKTYAGAWFEPSTGIVHVAATTEEAARNAEQLGGRYGLAVRSQVVKLSEAELERIADELRAGKDPIGAAARGQIGIEVETNHVLAAVPAELVERLQREAGPGVKVVADENLKTDEDVCTTRTNCDDTIRAGNILWRGSSASRVCSVGFTARTAANTRFTYTAGHCSNGNGVTWGNGARSIGPMSASMNFLPVDAAIIQVTNPFYTGHQGGQIYMHTLASRFVPVRGVAPTLGFIVPGETVCLAANFTAPTGGNRCGVVGTRADVFVRGMVRVNGLDACGGDSGGGWYWLPASGNRFAYGIHSRSSTGCNGSDGGSRSWFSAIPVVRSLFTPGLAVETR